MAGAVVPFTQATSCHEESVKTLVPHVAKVTRDMHAQLNEVEKQRKELKDILHGYGKEKRKMRQQTSALFRKVKKLKEGDIEIIADIKGIRLHTDDAETVSQSAASSSAAEEPDA